MVFYDKDALGELAGQYYRKVETIYPRGNITDRTGISFNHTFSEIFPTVSLPRENYPACVSQVVGKTETDPFDTTEGGSYGINGINLIYDELLRGGSAIGVYCMADAGGRLLEDMGATVIGEHINEGCDITLTLDYVAQRNFEEIISEYAEEKSYDTVAVTLTDCESGEIIVMATYGSELNLNVLSYPPGSIMKIISAAAAIEEGLITPEDEFVCHGEFMVGEEVRHCSGKAVHGKMSMAEAFGISCNEWAYYVNSLLCEKKGDVIISRALLLARKWGFCEYGFPGHEFILEYDDYYSFVPEYLYNDMDIFNASLGQGNIQASVYLINKITSAIASGGKITTPHIISKITDPAGNEMFDGKSESGVFTLGLKEKTVKALQTLFRQTCVTGSAEFINIPQAAGKTGTAENGEGGAHHSWFTGYFPAGERTYAMTVLIPSGGSAPYSAVPLWEMLADEYRGL